jgi:hypothetical protein
MLKHITSALTLIGIIMLVVGLLADKKDIAALGVLLACLFGLLRALLSVTRLF